MSTATVIRPQLRLVDLTIIVVGLVVGMGIFRTPVEVANSAGQPDIFFLAWIAGAIISFVGALIFAEIGSRYPHAGGFYKIFSHCYHPAFAFMVNWITVMSNAASTALVALMGAEYIAPLLFPEWKNGVSLVAIVSTLLLFLTNLSGIRLSSRILNLLMAIKISLLLIIISSIFLIAPHESQSVEHALPSFSGSWWNAFFLCFIPVFFTYGGYQQTMNFGSDIKNAPTRLPRATMIGMLIVMTIYLLVNYAYYHSLGFDHLRTSSTLASDIPGILFGNVANKAVSLIMFLSIMAYVNVSMMSNPRVYYAMAEDKVMPSLFMQVNKKTQTQNYALVLFTIFILITLLFAHSVEHLLKYVMFFDSIGFITAAAAIFIFRSRAKKAKTEKPPFAIRGYPFLPIIFILVYGSITFTIFYNDHNTAIIGFVPFIAGLPLYYLLQQIIRRASAH